MWGTLSLCSSGAVQNAIKRICGITSIRVKRKEKELAGGKKQWWFVIHDDEDILCALGAKWKLIEVQTSWKLESCYHPISSDSHSSTIDLKHSAIVEEAVQPADKVPEHDLHSSTDNSQCESHSSSVSAVSSTHCHAISEPSASQPADNVLEHDSHSSTDNSNSESHSSSVFVPSPTTCHAGAEPSMSSD